MRSKLSAAQRRELIIVLGVSLVGVFSLWYWLLGAQLVELGVLADRLENEEIQKEYSERMLTQLDKWKREQQQATGRVITQESAVATGDYFRWVIRNLTPIQTNHNVSIISFRPPRPADPVPPPPANYNTIRFGIQGSAYFHDIVSFIDELEQRLQFARITSLTLQAVGPGAANLEDREKLTFDLEFDNLATTTPAQ